MKPGDLIDGKYRLKQLLGSGGMGSVWAARNEKTDRDFALKALLPGLVGNDEAKRRFLHEARACGQIKHPAVVDVYDMGEAEDGSPYLVMELLEGEGFDQRLEQAGTFRPIEAATWIAFIARGLAEAHARGLIHRDLKPGNVFFARDGRGDMVPKILDFGISKATHGEDLYETKQGAVLGSPAYMSPEQARGETDVDARSDIWSLGVIMYEALTGEIPYDGPNYNALMVSIITDTFKPVIARNPSVPEELSAIVDRALEKDRSKRIASASELAELLEAFALKHGDGTVALLHGARSSTLPSRPSAPPRSTSVPPGSITQGAWTGAQSTSSRRRSSMVAAALGLAATLVLIGGGGAFYAKRPPMIAVAGRSAAALTAAKARLDGELDRLKLEAQAEKEKAAQTESERGLSPQDLPNPKKATTPAAPAVPRAPRRGSADPHGGVESAGF